VLLLGVSEKTHRSGLGGRPLKLILTLMACEGGPEAFYVRLAVQGTCHDGALDPNASMTSARTTLPVAVRGSVSARITQRLGTLK
jgi:hypothetical protein